MNVRNIDHLTTVNSNSGDNAGNETQREAKQMAFTFNKTNVASTAAKAPAQETGTEIVNSEYDTTGDAFAAKAIALAAKEDDGMSEAVGAVMKAKEDWQGGPIKILFAMTKAYGEELAQFPVPDDEGSNNPDKLKITVTNPDGKTTQKNTTFYAQFSDATREGKAIVQEIEWIKRAGNADMNKAGIPDAILELNPIQRDNRLNFLAGRRATIRGAYKKAMALGFQMQAVNGVQNVTADFIYVTDNDGNDTTEVVNTTKPIIVFTPPAAGKPVTKFETFSIGAFLKLNAGKAFEKGGGLKALKDTVTRNTDGGATGNNGKATEVPPIKTVDTFLHRFVEVYRYANEMQYAKDQRDYAALVKLLKHKDSDELAVAMVEMEMFLSDCNKELGLSKRYNDLQKKGSELPSGTKQAA